MQTMRLRRIKLHSQVAQTARQDKDSRRVGAVSWISSVRGSIEIRPGRALKRSTVSSHLGSSSLYCVCRGSSVQSRYGAR